MTPSEFIILFILVAAIFYWVDTIFVKETAVKHGKERCKELGVTFLDETAEIKKVRIKRNPRGTVKFQREYSFEFSSDGIRRFNGTIIMLGKVLVDLKMSAYPETVTPETSIPDFKAGAKFHATYDSTVVDISDAKKALDSKSKKKSDPDNKFPTGFR